MSDSIPFLLSLLSLPGLPGHEYPVARLIENEWTSLVDDLSFSRLGSVHGFKRGTGENPRPAIMISAHMDAVGLMVTQITEGFLRITPLGQIDPRILPGQSVVVHTNSKDLPGVICMPPAKLLPPEEGSGVVPISHLFVDVGYPPSKVTGLVQVGDLVSFNVEPIEMSGGIVSGHSLDNRVSIATITLCLHELQNFSHEWDVWITATVMEELNLGGATTSSYELRPDLAIVIDTTFAEGPDGRNWQSFKLGEGPTFGHGPNIHPHLSRQFTKLAKDIEIPYETELLPESSGTDGIATQITAEGIPTFVLSIPIRYMHTPVEMVAMKDIYRGGRLLTAFITNLRPDFIDHITWDD